ncbi:hypothetical protein CDAR_247981 [Caerostris darwini]|uniref:Uncharacterized protein n=1 Tax=Caerostris darwini TaxID=1538125 RepID=A0AAV4VKW0_9ARAC|nr:hypothetical protein CDAR_247981 [Caerostris darwini]
MLIDAIDDERNLNTANKAVFLDATVTIERDLLNTTAHVEKNIDSNKNKTLLDMVIDEGNIFDILYNTVEFNIVANTETIMNIGDNKNILDKDIDDKYNLNIDNNNVVLDNTVSGETMLSVDNQNVVQETAPEITPSLISNRKEILLDVVELLDKIKDKNVFLDNNHEPIPRSNMLKKNTIFKKIINKFTIRKSKKTVQNISTVSSGRLKSKLVIPQSH